MQPQDLCFTIFSTFVRGKGQLAWSGGLVRLLGEMGVPQDGARAALNRLAQRGLIVRTKRGREVFYGLTPETQALMEAGDQRLRRFGEAVGELGTWTVLWHSLPDELRSERTALSRWLRLMGFGSVQHATWFAPHDRGEAVVEVLGNLGVAQHACVLVGQPMPQLDLDVVLHEAWDLGDVQQRYGQFLEEFGPYRTKTAQRKLDDSEAFVVCTRATQQFRGFPYLDPELPDRFMPRPALRPKAIALFRSLYEGLLPQATRHFTEVAGDKEEAEG
ncbi:PaaX family transcriptional regulator [Streptomyces sp. NPDC004838]